MDNRMGGNIESILWAIEILLVGGVACIFVLYFVIKHKIKKNQQASEE